MRVIGIKNSYTAAARNTYAYAAKEHHGTLHLNCQLNVLSLISVDQSALDDMRLLDVKYSS